MAGKIKKITKKTDFQELIQDYPEAVEVLLESGMHCIGCPMASMETLEDGALAYGIDPDELVRKINKKLGKIREKNDKRQI